MKQSSKAFPDDFFWGASLAAHQVEGNLHNQWSEWEDANAERLARGARATYGRLPIWPHIAEEAQRPETYVSGRGTEHYEHYTEDFGLLKEMHMNAFRFSIEWSRIEPEEGVWNAEAIAHYRAYITELRRLGIEPFPTLWHWTIPVWFAAKGGFAKRTNVKYFERFVAKMSEEYAGLLTYVITFNEPNGYADVSYVLGLWPPQRHNLILAIRVLTNLAYAHRRAYAVLKRAKPSLQVSVAMHIIDIRPLRERHVFDRLAAVVWTYAIDWLYLDLVRSRLDFIGVNYYMTKWMSWLGRYSAPHHPLSDVGWHMRPRAIRRVLRMVWRRYHKPIVITENGVADTRDHFRQWWLEKTVEGMELAIAEGVDVRGYLHWSLTDNFEWAYGWWAQYGLASVERTTMQRTLRPSAQWFARFIQRQRLDD